MRIEVPEQDGPYKYVWLNDGNDDYVDFDDPEKRHEDIAGGIYRRIGLNPDDDPDDQMVQDAGLLLLDVECRKMTILEISERYERRANPSGFKRFVESNTDYEVLNPFGDYFGAGSVTNSYKHPLDNSIQPTDQ
jgi:hypothetical protein